MIRQESKGYGYKFNKTYLSQSWFNKGGVAYTFFQDSTNTTSVENKNPAEIVTDFNLSVFPNPFNPQTIVRVEAPAKSFAEISIYDITGKQVETLFKGEIQQGIHNFKWNASNLPSGMYLIRTVSGSYVKTVKALLIK